MSSKNLLAGGLIEKPAKDVKTSFWGFEGT